MALPECRARHPGYDVGEAFKKVLGLGILGMVPGTSRQKAEIEAPDNSAQLAARKKDAELLIKSLPQISPPPAHHPMHGSDRVVLDRAHQASNMAGVRRVTTPPHDDPARHQGPRR